MWPATAWDDADWLGNRARGWTVMAKLRERQQREIEQAKAARRRIDEHSDNIGLMTAVSKVQGYVDELRARWNGGPTVLAFLFAHPESDAMRMLDARGEYFDIRTGDTWDLFFPGYYRSKHKGSERKAAAQPLGRCFGSDWYFNASDFNALRDHIERSSERRWKYSGGADLVLVNGWLFGHGEPTVDWASTISGQLSDQSADIHTLTLANVIERITNDLETAAEDQSYGVGEVTDEPAPTSSHVGREFMINALAGIAAALGLRVLGA